VKLIVIPGRASARTRESRLFIGFIIKFTVIARLDRAIQ
jgi:hypothetical protein